MGRCLIALLAFAGCDSLFGLDHVEPGAFVPATCSVDADCVRGSEPGHCNCGNCAYADSACPATNLRWAEAAKDGLGKTCVPAPESVDATVFVTCSLMSDGSVWCWGANDNGELGNAQELGVESYLPVHVEMTGGNLVGPFTDFAVGAFHVCGLHEDTTAWCWGSNGFGQLGAGLTVGMDERSRDPVQVMTSSGPLTNTIAIASGYFHTCAIAGSPFALYCWGDNPHGQLGRPTASVPTSNVAVAVALPAGNLRMVSAGGGHTCAIVDKHAYCWGRQLGGRLGNNQSSDVAVPMPQRVAWNTSLEPLPDVVVIEVANRHTCAIKRPNGEVYCWGDNADGKLGDGTTMSRAIATLGAGPVGDYQRVSGGDRHTCATYGPQTLCWGFDLDGRVGDGPSDTASKLVPKAAIASDRNRVLAAAFEHTCALGDDRKIRCWGANARGQLGVGDTVARHEPTEIEADAFCPRR